MGRICPNCGKELLEDQEICDVCGTKLDDIVVKEKPKKRKKKDKTLAEMLETGEQVTENVVLCDDGKYRWFYKLNLFKTPIIIFTILKIFFFIALGVFAVSLIANATKANFFWDGVKESLTTFGIVVAIFFGLSILGYLVYAAIMHGSYNIMFEMDEKGINHKQFEDQAKKARKIGEVAAVAGIATGRFSTLAAGVAATKTEMYTEFENTKSVKSYKKLHLIKIDKPFNHNQVYVAKEDFDFVKEYIYNHCPIAKKR